MAAPITTPVDKNQILQGLGNIAVDLNIAISILPFVITQAGAVEIMTAIANIQDQTAQIKTLLGVTGPA